MDATFLNDLLECSVCLEQLDSTSKVLPCQHTFCKQCLEEIVSSHKELRCPECRVLVETKIEDLPCNILLIRLLDGIKNNNARNPKLVESSKKETSSSRQKLATSSSSSSSSPLTQNVVRSPPHSVPQYVPRQRVSVQPDPGKMSGVSKHYNHSLPCAKALYPYDAKEPGDLSFKKGDIIFLKKRIDQNWYHGELNSKSGFLPASYVQVLAPISHPIPQCKALYDFSVSTNDEQDCLTFSKGDILTVIRRIDENWAEGKLGDKVGIFPVSFAQMNSAARTIMKLSANTFSGPSRTAPPTPSESSVVQIDQPTCASVDEGTVTTVAKTVEATDATKSSVTNPGTTFLEQGTSSSVCASSISYSTTATNATSSSVMSVSAFPGESVRSSDSGLVAAPSHSISHSTPTPSVRNSSSSSLSSSSSSSTSSNSSTSQALSAANLSQPSPSSMMHLQTHHHRNPHSAREKRHSLAMIGANQRSPQILPGNSSHRHSMEILNILDCCNLNDAPPFGPAPSSSGPVTVTTTSTVATVSALSSGNARAIPPTPAQIFQTPDSNLNALASSGGKNVRRGSTPKDKEAFTTGTSVCGGPPSAGPSSPLDRSLRNDSVSSNSTSAISSSSCTLTQSSSPISNSNHSQPNLQNPDMPIYYVALYNYKPQKEDELELKKGELYTVSEKCQDGWFKGTALHSARSGVFPGNYVHVAKPSLIQAQFSQPSAVTNVRSMAGKNPFATPSVAAAALCHSRQRSLCSSVKLYSSQQQQQPVDPLDSNMPSSSSTSSPEGLSSKTVTTVTQLPVNKGPGAELTTAPICAPQATPLNWVSLENTPPGKTQVAQNQHELKQEAQNVNQGSPWPKPWPNDPIPSVSDTNAKSEEKPSQRNEQQPTVMVPSSGQSLVSTTSAISNSHSQRSMDNFPSSSVGNPQVWLGPNSLYSSLVLSTAASAVTPPNVSLGMTPQCGRSGLPGGSHGSHSSQHGLRSERKEKKEKEKVSLMKRLTSKRKSRSPPPSNYSCDNPSFVDSFPQYTAPQKPSAIHTRSGSCPSEAFGSQNTVHKKTSSLDGSSNETPKMTYKSKQPPPLVRERFRCIVPYPPNSEFELELKVGDMVYVHKKRDDGWYKGTLQRTGKTGLFPASFVDSCN